MDNFNDMLRDRYMCTSDISLTEGFDINSKTVDKLQVDDVVEVMNEPRQSELGIMRVEIKSLKDGAKGWVTMKGNQGKTYFGPYSAYAAYMKGLEKSLAATKESLMKAVEYINTKNAELRDVKQGPLVETKAEFVQIRPKLATLQAKYDQL